MAAKIRWKRSHEHYVDSQCGQWRITPEYWSCVYPRGYALWRDNRKIGGGETQRECKEIANRTVAKESA